MGLAEPRKRLKISHDPNNLTWSTSSNSYGQRLMLSQGWKAGEGLGASNRRGFNSYDNARINVSFKDDNLGLGATLKSKDVEHSRTGLDAFQGLLGRLNGKSDVEIELAEKKVEDRKLAMFAQGKWGSMLFVPGGLLEQQDDFKIPDVKKDEANTVRPRSDAEAIANMKRKQKGGDEEETTIPAQFSDTIATAKAQRRKERLEKRQRKEGRRKQKAERAAVKDISTTAESADGDASRQKKRKQTSKSSRPLDEESSVSRSVIGSAEEIIPATSGLKPTIRNGRHLLRGRNIAAKKMAFADAKLLDEIFMRRP